MIVPQFACSMQPAPWAQEAQVQHDSTHLPHSEVADLPSIGSRGHGIGECRPCAFLHTKGCSLGKACEFCHLCGSDEKKKRQKEKRQHYKQLRTEQALSGFRGRSEYSGAVDARSNPGRASLSIQTQFEESDAVSTEEPTSFPSTPSPMGFESRPSAASIETEKVTPRSAAVKSEVTEVRHSHHARLSRPIGLPLYPLPRPAGRVQIIVDTDLDIEEEPHSPSMPSTMWPATPDPLTPDASSHPAAMLFSGPALLFQSAPPQPVAAFADTMPAAPLNMMGMPPPPVVQMQSTNPTALPPCSSFDDSQVEDVLPAGKARVLSLDDMILYPATSLHTGAEIDSIALPSVGSKLHFSGICKPCGFFHRAGCAKGAQCEYCHVCGPEEKKRRQREKKEMLRAVVRMRA